MAPSCTLVSLVPARRVHQAEVGHLDVIAHQKQIARLDVQMLQVELEVHEVQHLGRLAQVAEQLAARHARLPLGPILLQKLVEILVGQLGDDDQFPADVLDAVHRQQKRMANRLDMLDGPQLFLGPNAVVVQAVEVAINELDRLENAARRLALPDFAKTPRTQRFDQAITSYGFGIWLLFEGHGIISVDGMGGSKSLKPRSKMGGSPMGRWKCWAKPSI